MILSHGSSSKGGARFFTFFLSLLFLSASLVYAQECSSSQPCTAGCCSKFGYCGWGDDFCGSGCLNSCNAKKDCDANNPCKFGCCSKFGFCGLGGDFCSPENCVAGCQTKSQCDPGWGLDYSNHSTCPLNVCCSKHGFCGTAKEFCGEETVNRPSCVNKSQKINRVIGYYEAWAQNRMCNRIRPEDITAGVYTHINFAFGSIDASSFSVVPGGERDVNLWRRMTAVRFNDPGVKIWLAIGGWTFNDEDQPTRMTFSDIAASESRQGQFFQSLIAIMQTYQFDGVDLDWEYPRAPDRSGRDADYANFPVFVSRLRSALKNANPEYGLSITIPISFWYLQHFDIKALQPNVDWLNIMSYDLHGKWDLSTDYGKEHGAFLNAHTNLTEIRDMIDLLWRNDINPQMVNLGLAFYGRSATAASPACVSPGCQFVSAGLSGLCSNEAGVLLNTEIDQIIKENSLKPNFDKEAAVKWISWGGNQWVSYDDGDTLRLKADFARSSCLGGVMVWAVSHDTVDGKFATGLVEAVDRAPVKLPGGGYITIATRMTTSDQDKYCRWTNCDEDCPNGFGNIVRADGSDFDPDNPSMVSSSGCIKGTRKWCCPKAKLEWPLCRWRGFKNNGACEPGCSQGEAEVGTSSQGCTHSGFVSACCTNVETTAPYAECKWVGTAPKCSGQGSTGTDSCPSDYPNAVVRATHGSGGMPACDQGFRTLCCRGKEPPKAFQRCEWQSKFKKPLSEIMCDDSCPPGQIQVARTAGNSEHGNKCWLSYHGYCCAGGFSDDGSNSDKKRGTGISKAQLNELEFYLEAYAENPTCPAGVGLLKRMELVRRGSMGYENFLTLAVLLSAALSPPTIRTDMRDLVANYFGYSRDIATVDELHTWGVRQQDGVEFFSSFLCNPMDVTAVMRARQSAETQLCEVRGASSVKREPLALRSKNIAAPDTANKGLTADPLHEFDERIFGDGGNGRPLVQTALEGAVNGDLTLHYARWLRFRSNRSWRYFGLEVAYWIGPRVGTAPSEEIRRRYTTPGRSDELWVVFHLHFESDNPNDIDQARNRGLNDGIRPGQQMFERIPGTTNSWGFYAGATFARIYHGTTIQGFSNADPRVRFSDTGGGVNHRAEVYNCRRSNGRWYIGRPAPPGAGAFALALAAWGQHLVQRQIANMASFTYIFPDTLGRAETQNNQMPHRQPRPVGDALYDNFGPDGHNIFQFEDIRPPPPVHSTHPAQEELLENPEIT